MTIQLTMFDYATLDAETRIVVQQRTTEIRALMKRAASDIIEIGQKLIEVKARLGHGRFGGWLESEFDWTPRTAQQFMLVADTFKNENFSHLNVAPSALYLLAAPSTPDSARQEAISRAEEGETITHGVAKSIIHDHRYPSEPFIPTAEDYSDPYGDDEPDLWVTPASTNSNGVHAPQIEVIDPRYAPISDRDNYDGDEWKTPPEWIDAARSFLGCIDLDPASNDSAQAIVQATNYYTKQENGIDRHWCLPDGTPARVWCNPPYSAQLIKAFAQKAVEEYDAGRMTEGLLLVNNCTDTGWFFELAERFPMMFSRGRVRFWYDHPDDETPTRQGQTIFYFGKRCADFYDAFEQTKDDSGRSLAYVPNGRFIP